MILLIIITILAALYSSIKSSMIIIIFFGGGLQFLKTWWHNTWIKQKMTHSWSWIKTNYLLLRILKGLNFACSIRVWRLFLEVRFVLTASKAKPQQLKWLKVSTFSSSFIFLNLCGAITITENLGAFMRFVFLKCPFPWNLH